MPKKRLYANAAECQRAYRARKKEAMKRPMMGKFVHIFKDGVITNQGHVVDEGADYFMIELFSWSSGDLNGIVMKAKTNLIENTIFYNTIEDMRSAYDRRQKLKSDVWEEMA